MNTIPLSFLCLGLLAADLLPTPAVDNPLQIGEIAKYKFKEPPLNGLGVTSLENLRGKPVLVAHWGNTGWMDDWVEDILAWQQEYGEDLAVVFVEMQASPRAIEVATVQKSWIRTRAMWTTEYTVDSGLRGVPQYALLSSKGELVKNGLTSLIGCNFLPRRLEELADAIAEQVHLRRSGPEGLPKHVAKAWKDFAKGKLAATFKRLQGLLEADSEEVREAAQSSLDEFETRVTERLDRSAALMAVGRMVEAEETLETLEKQLELNDALNQRLQVMQTDLFSEANAEEYEASKALAKIEKKLLQKGPSSAVLKALVKLDKKFPGTKNAERAIRLIELAAK